LWSDLLCYRRKALTCSSPVRPAPHRLNRKEFCGRWSPSSCAGKPSTGNAGGALRRHAEGLRRHAAGGRQRSAISRRAPAAPSGIRRVVGRVALGVDCSGRRRMVGLHARSCARAVYAAQSSRGGSPFCEYAVNPQYPWIERCEAAFGQVPKQVCHEWNTTRHIDEYDHRPERREVSRDELRPRCLWPGHAPDAAPPASQLSDTPRRGRPRCRMDDELTRD